VGQDVPGAGGFALQLPVEGEALIALSREAGEICPGALVELGGEALLQGFVGGGQGGQVPGGGQGGQVPGEGQAPGGEQTSGDAVRGPRQVSGGAGSTTTGGGSVSSGSAGSAGSASSAETYSA
jgi:hypothetical protein